MTLEAKNLDTPDQTHRFEHGTANEVTLGGGVTISRAEFRPGWKWSEDVKPMAGTESCQDTHTGYGVTGRLHVRMDDGQEMDLGPGDAHRIGPGHDAWVVGDEPCVIVDFATA